MNRYRAVHHPDDLQELFLNTLDFHLYSCGVSHKNLPYIESWTLRPNGYISQVLHATTTIYTKSPVTHTLTINPGEAVILPPNFPHRSETLKNITQTTAIFRWAHFQFFIAHSIDVFTFFELPFLLSVEQGELFGNFNRRFTELYRQKGNSALKTSAEIKKTAFELLCVMLRVVPLNKKNLMLSAKICRIEPALSYIDQNYSKKIATESLAEISGMSLTRFHVTFRNITGITPIEYLIRQRMRKAQQLLWLTDMPISSVALTSGYADQFFFCKLFKKKIGLTPSQYRCQAQNAE